MLKIFSYPVLWIAAFMFPRLLVGAGVPLDQWAAELGALTGQPWLQEWWLEIGSLLLAIALSAVELWLEPVGGFWRFIKSKWTGEKGLVEQKVQHPEIERDLVVYNRNSHEVQVRRGDSSTVIKTIQLEPDETFEGWRERSGLGGSASEQVRQTEFIPLHDAAMEAYSALKLTLGISVIERMQSFERSKLPGRMAHLLIDDSVPVFGEYPPESGQIEMPNDHRREYGISDDATEMFDQFKKSHRYVNLKIKRSDLERRIEEMRLRDGSR